MSDKSTPAKPVNFLDRDTPLDNETCDVMGGYLCECHGKANPQTFKYYPRVYATRVDAGDPRPADPPLDDGDPTTPPPVLGNGWYVVDMTWDAGIGKWRYNFDRQIAVDSAATVTTNNNKLCLYESWRERNGFFLEEKIIHRVDTEFKGKSVTSCSGGGPQRFAANLDGPMAFPGLEQLVEPVCCEDGWYLYANIPNSNTVYGNKLMVGGNPLSASQLAIATQCFDVKTTNLCGNQLSAVHPSGMAPHLEKADSEFVFEDSPILALGLLQYDGTYKIVQSNNKNDPNVIDTDPTRPIYVRVNGDLLANYEGAYDLWVKPLKRT